MLRRVIYAALERKLNRAYEDRLAALGPVPKGVFWRNQSTQIARFDALLNLVTKVTPVANPTLGDVGCGYGAMLDFIQKTSRYQHLNYIGIDINRAMINSCKRKFPDHKNMFFVGKSPRHRLIFAYFLARLIFAIQTIQHCGLIIFLPTCASAGNVAVTVLC